MLFVLTGTGIVIEIAILLVIVYLRLCFDFSEDLPLYNYLFFTGGLFLTDLCGLRHQKFCFLAAQMCFFMGFVGSGFFVIYSVAEVITEAFKVPFWFYVALNIIRTLLFLPQYFLACVKSH